MKQKAFFIIFIGLSLKQLKKNFLEGESPTLKEDTIVEVMELICKENPYLYQDQRYTTYAFTFT